MFPLNVIQPTTQYIISTEDSGTAVATIPYGFQAYQTVNGQPIATQTTTNATQHIQIGGQPIGQQMTESCETTQTTRSLGKGIAIQKQTQEVVINVFNYLRSKNPNKNQTFEETSKATKVRNSISETDLK